MVIDHVDSIQVIIMNTTEKLLAATRQCCLSLPETSETDAWGHPNFKAGKCTFVVWEWIRDRPSIAFRLDPADQEACRLMADFFDTPYGKGQWISLWADDEPDWFFVEDLILKSYRTVALKRMLKALPGEAS